MKINNKHLIFVLSILFLTIRFSCAADEQGGSMKTAGDNITLPAPQLKGAVSLEESIQARRSKRSFSDRDLSLEQVSQLLWSCQGITHERRGYRAAPSAGALYPLEVYVVKKDGFFSYMPKGHKLKLISSEDLRAQLAGVAYGQRFIQQAPLNIVICAVYSRVTSRYGNRGVRYTDMEVGHAGQNVQLEAVALGLGSCCVGAFGSEAVAKLLKLPPDQEPLYIIPVGYTK